MKRSSFRLTLAIAVLLAGMNVAQASPIVIFDTGVDASGNVLPDGTIGDLHYTLTYLGNGGAPVGPGTPDGTIVKTSASAFPVPPWVGDDSLSAWIGPFPQPAGDPTTPARMDGLPGYYEYHTTFNLVGDPLTASLSGRWSMDNEGIDIFLNGIATGNTVPGDQSFRDWHPFSISGPFILGTNTLDFLVHNDPGSEAGDTTFSSPTAVRVEVTGRVSVPEPATLALLGLGLAGLGLLRRK